MNSPTPAPTAIRLPRGILARAFGGFLLQPILALSLLVSVGLYCVLATLDGPVGALRELSQDPKAWLGLIWWAIWGMGVTAHAEADDDGISWRYYRKHHYPWAGIEQIRFGGVRRAVGGGAWTPGILLSVGGREHPIIPALGCDTQRRTEFGHELIRLATARGVDVSIDADTSWWRGLRTA